MKWRACTAVVVLLFATALHIAAGPAQPDSDGQTATRAFEPDENMVQAETGAGRYSLWMNALNAAVCLADEKTGNTWWTNPIAPKLDVFTTDAAIEEMRAQLVVRYYDEDKVVKTVNTVQCLENDTVQISHIPDGFQAVYDFTGPEENFSLTLQYTLTGDRLQVALPAGGIEERGSARISEVDVLPHFLSGNRDEEGYLFLPDGAGALMTFADYKPNAAPYRQTVYGRDTAVSLQYEEGKPLTASLPVLGMVKEGAGLLAVIEGNAAAAVLSAVPTGVYADCANAGVTFVLRQMDRAVIANKDWTYNEYPVVNPNRSANDCVLAFYPVPENADYSVLAGRYRDLLDETAHRAPASSFLHGTLEFYGHGWKTATFLGFPVKKNVTATTFAQVRASVDRFAERGLTQLGVQLIGFGDEGYERSSSDKMKPAGSLGGRKGLEVLIGSLPDGGQVFWSQDLVRLFGSSRNAIQSLSHVTVKGGRYLLSTGAMEENGRRWQYSRADAVLRRAGTLENSLIDGLGVDLGLAGAELYSDYSDARPMEREQASADMAAALDAFGKRPVAVAGGNLYAALRADLITDLPAGASGFDCMSASVPFYGMVFYGYASLCGTPLNTVDDWDEALLDCLEYGVAPAWQLTGCSNRALRETSLSFLYNTAADEVAERAISLLERYEETAARLDGRRMLSHRRENGVVQAAYSGNVRLVINRSGQPTVFEGVSLPPGEWRILE